MHDTKRTLFLHIGSHRTATTAIQSTMFANREFLRRQGVLYPLGVQKHIGLINRIFGGQTTASAAAAMLNERADAQDLPIHTVVLSDEAISKRRDLTPLSALQEQFEVKVVVAMRRQDLWLESWWAQNVKGQWDRELCHVSWPDFLADRARFHWIDFDRYINHAEAVFGKGSVLPYVFERGQMPEGPVAAFMKQIGVERAAKMRPAGGDNISLSPTMSEFLRHLPLIDAPMKFRLELISMAERVDKQLGGQKTKLMIPHEERLQILAEYEKGNSRIAKRFFDRDQLFFDPVPGPDEPVVVPALPGTSEETMNSLVTPYLNELVGFIARKL